MLDKDQYLNYKENGKNEIKWLFYIVLLFQILAVWLFTSIFFLIKFLYQLGYVHEFSRTL